MLFPLFGLCFNKYLFDMPGFLLANVGEHDIDEVVPRWLLGVFVFKGILFEL